MAIYSLNHNPISKSKHPSGRAGAHLRYISRDGAAPVILANQMPNDWREARNWMDEQEQGDRSNARIADRLMIALPIELTRKEREKLVQEYLDEVTGNAVPWYAAIHQEGKDSHNPHVHILIRDRSPIDGRRVIKTSERYSTQHFREKWTQRANLALSRANLSERIDNRSLIAQGIDREPTKHQGWKKYSPSIIESEAQTWVEKTGGNSTAKTRFFRA